MDDQRVTIEFGGSPGGGLAVQIHGDLDLTTADDARSRLEAIVAGADGDVVLDLAGLGFIDSTGLGALVAVQNRASQVPVTVRLTGVSSQVRRVMEITRLDELFEIV